MKILYLSFMLLFTGAVSQTVWAQSVSLADLLAIGAEPAALTTPEDVTKHLPAEWQYKAPTINSREALWVLPAAEGLALPVARITVRAQRPGQDVVLKTTDASSVRGLRNELKSKKLIAEPVTCPSCEGMRFKGSDFEATIYSEMKGDYPFVVVVHQVPATVSGPAAKDSGAKPKAQ